MKRSQSLTGLVTAGGRSTRMGADKGLLEINGVPWAVHAREKLLAVCRQASISISREQYPAYSAVMDPRWLVADDPLIENAVSGPIVAAVSAARKFPGQDLLILACDLTDLEPMVLRELVSAYESRREFSCYAFRSLHGFEPLCAIYRAASLQRMLELPATEVPPSLQAWLSRERTYPLGIRASHRASFRNRNRPQD